MILIVSNNKETTTTEVTKWLSVMGKKYIRIHENEIFEIKVFKKRIFLESVYNSFFLDDISSVWFRRGRLRFKRLLYKNAAVNIHMNEVQYWLEDYIVKNLESKKAINKNDNLLNKLFVLEKAKEAGLNIPPYFLAENTEEVELSKTITKTIAGNSVLENISEAADAIMYTSLIEEKEKNSFFITLFQEKIEKDFEIRSFYLNGKIWSIAILSQNDEQTRIDYRKYNSKIPNRNIAYKLPKEIEDKVDRLMKILDLNCGSIDFIKSGNMFYFLEINPSGQFLGLSITCNYNLEKEIASYL
ncbi:grasp-with-spasm system ATP-grasp peptide maturase [Elizabethkingia meningoseptica]|uniref:grasp-with-spasm system ATP-grasp peptide maturase n=1 Tax=Elizabethkingia meningoseptica TaxID=238 RepID=UPI0022F1A146|nr:grasp-with-spasm system ATP-grasp peptide maturase [Elizabethkingia meningoseptica]EJK5330074.1 grasp-with-spasm system ATP-grasp peptide maturase [Elizabethkingia meningoseptica]MDE5466495.1 grasp-with-spasm system ATP-grasp peptide maturase [Elizabethkingia meningoseptica]MDE5474275.1 grasp-with-spasm system ATP-grasp peptide maturase [Elizabethkingia meningoseptica]MDE5477708.1 grasp-with-spasm system ATP-grasp peptide maturase [Elizabethkingia meningoseptica]MDE5483814.1 grasp-with-spas